MANAKFNYPPRCRREWRKSKPASSFLAISSRSYRTLRSSASQQTPVPAFGSRSATSCFGIFSIALISLPPA
jgi:hypothetical protein